MSFGLHYFESVCHIVCVNQLLTLAVYPRKNGAEFLDGNTNAIKFPQNCGRIIVDSKYHNTFLIM